MGLNPMPSIKHYWSISNSLFGCGYIKNKMSRDKFLYIHKYFTVFVNLHTASYNNVCPDQKRARYYEETEEDSIDEVLRNDVNKYDEELRNEVNNYDIHEESCDDYDDPEVPDVGFEDCNFYETGFWDSSLFFDS